MNDDGVAASLARLLSLPSWLPRAILRSVWAVFAVTFIVAPDTAERGLDTYVETQTDRITNLLAPLLTPTPTTK